VILRYDSRVFHGIQSRHAVIVFGPLEGGAMLEVEDQSEGSVAVEIVAMETLAPQKAQALVQLQAGRVGDFGLEDDFVGVSGSHGIDGEADEVGGDAAATVRLLDGQHGNVAAEGAAAMGLELADNDADEAGVGIVCLGEGCVRGGCWTEHGYIPCSTSPPTGRESSGRHRCCRARRGPLK
jgi:hypothetical protein